MIYIEQHVKTALPKSITKPVPTIAAASLLGLKPVTIEVYVYAVIFCVLTTANATTSSFFNKTVSILEFITT